METLRIPTLVVAALKGTGAFEFSCGLQKSDVKQVNTVDGMYLRIGDVALVRSANVPQEGDHFIVVTGHPIMKPHGLRPQTVSFLSSAKSLLDQFHPYNGVTLLKLSDAKAAEFKSFQNIQINQH